MNRTTLATVLLAAVVVAGMAVPVVALSGQSTADGTEATITAAQATNQTSVNVTVGQQLSTVIDVSSEEVQSDFENTAFELSVETENEEARAEAIADRTEEISDRAEDIREDYEDATEAYEDGEITRSQYAQRLAALNARASNLLDSHQQLRQRAANVSALELRAAGLNQTDLETAIDNLRSVNGTGAEALLAQFTGESRGEIELEAENGLSIEVESEDGDRSREFERPRDDDDTLTVNQSKALETARIALSTPENGSWVLTGSTVEHDDGAYEFEFALRNASGLSGDAEVAVDGSTGDIFSLEEEIELREEDERDDEEDERDDEDDEGELAMVLVDGQPAPNATVTLQVLADGASAENVTVYLNDQVAGTTDANGTVTVTLSASGEAELRAERDEAEADLEFEFESDDDDELFRNLNVDATLDNATVSVTVEYDGSGVGNATVYANDRIVGTTDAGGSVSFSADTNATDELELRIVKGAFETELSYGIDDGKLVLTEQEHETEDESETEEESESEDDSETEDDESDTEGETEDEPEDDSETESETEADETDEEDEDETAETD